MIGNEFNFPSPKETRYSPALVPYKKIVEEENGKTYTWLETVPENLPEGKVPLVIKLHGGGTDGVFAHDCTTWARLAVQEGFIAVFPSASHETHVWQVETDKFEPEVAYLDHIMDRVIEKYDIDETRIYLTGMSMGDMMSFAYACKSGNRLAALASFCGPSPTTLIWSWKPEHAVPVMQIRGEMDLGGYGLKMADSFLENFENKQETLISNRDLWLKMDGIEDAPEFMIQGIQNYSFYRGQDMDVYYMDVTGMGHREAAFAPYIVWRSFFTKYRRVDGKIVRTEEIAPLKADEKAAAFATDCRKALLGGKVVELEQPVITGTERTLPGMPEPARPKVIYPGATDMADAYYVPVSVLGMVPGIEVKPEADGSACEVTAGGKKYTFFKDSMLLGAENLEHLGIEKPVLYMDGKLMVPVAEICEALGKRVSVCEGVVYVADTENKISRGMARRIRKVLQ